MFKVLQIDHVELFVPDRYDAAKWYERVLGVTAAGFAEFVTRTPDLVTIDGIVDHQQAYSVYFNDPHGHQLEVTTYEYDDTSVWLASM